MSKFQIITDATSDLPEDIIERYNIVSIPMELSIDNKETRFQFLHQRDADETTITYDEFYKKIEAGAIVKTSLINTHTIISKMTPFLEKGLDVLYVVFDSSLSATYSQAILAQQELEETFPDRKIRVFDSLSASVQEGYLVMVAHRLQEQGKSIDEVVEHLEVLKHRINAYVTVENLDTLKRGGRVSSAAAFFGGLLKIKPILNVNKTGALGAVAKIRGRKQSLLELVAIARKKINGEYKGPLLIAHGNCQEEADYVVAAFKKEIGFGELVVTNLGPVISAHTGSGAVAIVYEAEDRS